jgi:hypothetical protein
MMLETCLNDNYKNIFNPTSTSYEFVSELDKIQESLVQYVIIKLIYRM